MTEKEIASIIERLAWIEEAIRELPLPQEAPVHHTEVEEILNRLSAIERHLSGMPDPAVAMQHNQATAMYVKRALEPVQQAMAELRNALLSAKRLP